MTVSTSETVKVDQDVENIVVEEGSTRRGDTVQFTVTRALFKDLAAVKAEMTQIVSSNLSFIIAQLFFKIKSN